MTSGPGKIEELQKLFQSSSKYTHLQVSATGNIASALFPKNNLPISFASVLPAHVKLLMHVTCHRLSMK